MSLVALILFGIFLVIVAIYIIVYIIYPGSGNNDILPNITSLNKKIDIYYSDQTKTKLLATGGSTIMAFFKLKGGNRTQNIDDTFNPLIQIANNLYLEVAPIPSGKDKVSTRLRIITQENGSRIEEYIDLPSIPQQKWVFIAIQRDGRRFDVIYDNQIVASQRLANYPVVIPSPLSIGDPNIDGSVVHVIINSKRLTPYAVERERVSHIDTNGVVLKDNKLSISFPAINLLAECPPGLPCDAVTRPPPSNLKMWSSPYA